MKNVLLAIIIVMSLVSGACHKAQPVAPAYETVTVNVQNPNGSYIPVTLTKVGGEFIGPRGERYLSMPTAEQLAPLYGVGK